MHREAVLRRRWGARSIGGLSAFSAAAAAGLVFCFLSLDRASPGILVQTVYGTILLGAGAGGYVLAGVLAFMAGVVVTVLCIRHRKRREEKHSEKSD